MGDDLRFLLAQAISGFISAPKAPLYSSSRCLFTHSLILSYLGVRSHSLSSSSNLLNDSNSSSGTTSAPQPAYPPCRSSLLSAWWWWWQKPHQRYSSNGMRIRARRTHQRAMVERLPIGPVASAVREGTAFQDLSVLGADSVALTAGEGTDLSSCHCPCCGPAGGGLMGSVSAELAGGMYGGWTRSLSLHGVCACCCCCCCLGRCVGETSSSTCFNEDDNFFLPEESLAGVKPTLKHPPPSAVLGCRYIYHFARIYPNQHRHSVYQHLIINLDISPSSSSQIYLYQPATQSRSSLSHFLPSTSHRPFQQHHPNLLTIILTSNQLPSDSTTAQQVMMHALPSLPRTTSE